MIIRFIITTDSSVGDLTEQVSYYARQRHAWKGLDIYRQVYEHVDGYGWTHVGGCAWTHVGG